MSLKNTIDTAEKLYEDKVYDQAFNVYMELAEKNNTYAQSMLGHMLYHALGVEKDLQSAYEWYKKAAVSDPHSQYYYGWYCIEEDKEVLGVEYLLKAAKNNHLDALYDLAGMYYYGIHTCKQNLDKAIHYYQEAAFGGNCEAVTDFLKAKSERDGKWKTFLCFISNVTVFSKAAEQANRWDECLDNLNPQQYWICRLLCKLTYKKASNETTK